MRFDRQQLSGAATGDHSGTWTQERKRYSESDIEDAQRAIYALGAFSAVIVSGDVKAPDDRVDVKIQLEPGALRKCCSVAA